MLQAGARPGAQQGKRTIRWRPGPGKGQTYRLDGRVLRAQDGPEPEMEEICGAPGQAVIRRADRAGGSLRFARVAAVLPGSRGCPEADDRRYVKAQGICRRQVIVKSLQIGLYCMWRLCPLKCNALIKSRARLACRIPEYRAV